MNQQFSKGKGRMAEKRENQMSFLSHEGNANSINILILSHPIQNGYQKENKQQMLA